MKLYRRHWKFLWKFAASAAFLAVVMRKVSMAELLQTLQAVHLGYYLLSLFFIFLNNFTLAWKFKVLIGPTGLRHSIGSLTRINFICRFSSMFLSTAVGQSLVRWHLTTRHQVSRFAFVGVMIVERTTFLLILCAAVLISLRLSPVLKHPVFNQSLALPAMVLLVLLSLFLAAIQWPVLHHRLDAAWRILTRRFRADMPAGNDSLFSLYSYNRLIWLKTFSIGLLWHMVFLLRVFLLVRSIDVPITFLQIMWMASLVLFLQAIPLSFNGLGIREAAYAYLFPLAGFPAAGGVTVGLLLFSQMLAVSAVGGYIYLFSAENREAFRAQANPANDQRIEENI